MSARPLSRSCSRHAITSFLPNCDLISMALLVSLPLIVCARDLFVGMKMMETDTITQGIPTMAWFGRTVRSGESILWTPGIIGGFPIGFSQYGLFSPIEWIGAALLDADRAYALTRVIYLSLAGISTYLYARVLGLSCIPSILAGVGYELSTDALYIPIHGNGSKSLYVLPMFLLSMELVVKASPRWSLLGAFAVGYSMLAGGPFITAIGLINSAIYVLARMLLLWKNGLGRHAIMLILSSALAVALGMGLAALRILPTTIVTAESIRAHGTSIAIATSGSQGILVQLAGYLLPLTGLKELSPHEFYVPSYVGPVILVLAGLSLLRLKRSSMVALLFTLFCFNLMASMGEYSPVFGLIHQLPFFGYFRGAFHFSAIAAFYLSLLAAYGLDSLPDKSLPRWVTSILIILAIVYTAIVVAAFIVGLLWSTGGALGVSIRELAEAYRLGGINPLRPRIGLALVTIPLTFWLLWIKTVQNIPRDKYFRTILLGLTTGLLLVIGANLPMRQQIASTVPATVEYLSQDQSKFRTLSHNSGIAINLILTMLAGGDPNKVNDEGPMEQNFSYRYSTETLSSSYALQYGLEAIDGYEPLQSIRQMIALAYLGSTSADIQSYGWGGTQEQQALADRLGQIRSRHLIEHLPVLRAFNVKYVLTNFELWMHSKDLRLAFSSQIAMLDPQSKTNIHVYEILGALPRAYLVPNNAYVSGPEEALEAILNEKVNPSDTVMLEEQLPPPAIGRLSTARSQVEIGSYKNTEMTLNVLTDGVGFLVINDAFYPGWEVWVDGEKGRILVANGWVRAIPIEAPGAHTVRLVYVPPLFAEGIWVSLVSLTFFIAALILPMPRVGSKHTSDKH